VGVLRVDAPGRKLVETLPVEEQVHGVTVEMPALYDDVLRSELADQDSRFLHVLLLHNPHPRKDLRLGDVRRDDRGQRDQVPDQGPAGLLAKQGAAALGYHDGIDDELADPVLPDLLRHAADDL